MKKMFYRSFVSSSLIVLFFNSPAQTVSDSSLQTVTLQGCVQYAEKHVPQVQKSLIDERVVDLEIRSRLADWYPQLNLNGTYQHNFRLQQVYFNGNAVPSGTRELSVLGLGATQNIFNRDLLLASRTARDVRTGSKQITVADRIDVAVNVSKAFYDVLLTQKQIEVLNDDIQRLERNLKDAYDQYQGGIVDKTDYKRATISLNNSRAEKKSDEELLKAKYAVLKQLMGYEGNNPLQLVYDSVQMESGIYIDTLAVVNYSNRIEYQYLLTQKRLQMANVQYNKWSYLPTLSAVGQYNLDYFSNEFSKLYAQDFPFSYAGLQLAFPIFQGGKRIENTRIAELQAKRVDWDLLGLRDSINSQYAQSLAIYKGALNDYHILKDNLQLAQDVFNTIELQYRSGIKAYLDLITAQTDLRNAESNYSNALYQVLSSKLDVERAIGTIQY
jgi:outer membrane protein